MTSRKRFERIAGLLTQEYQSSPTRKNLDPIEQLMFVLLSEDKNDLKFNDAFTNLDTTFDSWEAVRDSSVRKIASAIGCNGMAHQRARLVKLALEYVSTKFGELDLTSIGDMSFEEATRQLVAIPGVGVHEAKCILLYSFNKYVLPVNIHIYRLAIRLGILSRNISFQESHVALSEIVPWNLRRRFHVNAIAHTRARCSSTSPKCEGCPLSRMCSVPRAKHEPAVTARSKPLALELFSGAGGMSLGFSMAGFSIVQAIEKDDRAAATFRANHRRTDLIVDDVAELDPKEIASRVAIRSGDLAVIFGGPPCQGFSESNRRTRTLGKSTEPSI